VDPMHLVDLGVCRKLLLTWIRGPLERRLPKNFVEIISARLELLRDYIIWPLCQLYWPCCTCWYLVK
jgi:hypothetical protein